MCIHFHYLYVSTLALPAPTCQSSHKKLMSAYQAFEPAYCSNWGSNFPFSFESHFEYFILRFPSLWQVALPTIFSFTTVSHICCLLHRTFVSYTVYLSTRFNSPKCRLPVIHIHLLISFLPAVHSPTLTLKMDRTPSRFNITEVFLFFTLFSLPPSFFILSPTGRHGITSVTPCLLTLMV